MAAMVAGAAVLLSAGAPGLGQARQEAKSAQSEPRKARVLVKDNYFEPRSTSVADGGYVVWKWRGENRHNIRFTKVPGRASRKGAKGRIDGRWKRRFHRPGVYRYVCKLWSGMRGTVTVSEAEPPQGTRR